MEVSTEKSNEVLIDLLRRALETTGYYNFLGGQWAEVELRKRGVKVWNIDWHQSTKKIVSDPNNYATPPL